MKSVQERIGWDQQSRLQFSLSTRCVRKTRARNQWWHQDPFLQILVSTPCCKCYIVLHEWYSQTCLQLIRGNYPDETEVTIRLTILPVRSDQIGEIEHLLLTLLRDKSWCRRQKGDPQILRYPEYRLCTRQWAMAIVPCGMPLNMAAASDCPPLTFTASVLPHKNSLI